MLGIWIDLSKSLDKQSLPLDPSTSETKTAVLGSCENTPSALCIKNVLYCMLAKVPHTIYTLYIDTSYVAHSDLAICLPAVSDSSLLHFSDKINLPKETNIFYNRANLLEITVLFSIWERMI